MSPRSWIGQLLARCVTRTVRTARVGCRPSLEVLEARPLPAVACSAATQGDPHAASQLLPLVYDELRKLAAQKLAQEPPGQTLQPTALVHEAYLRLVASPELEREGGRSWDSRGHFFGAAAEAMRRILVEHARRSQAVKHGGGRRRVPLEEFHRVTESPEDLLDLDDALTSLAAVEPDKARLVQLRFFAGLSTPDAAAALGISVATAERWWTFSRAWLYSALQVGETNSSDP
jgi:RNA polymerase sigma factor (TIGR02999 family)